MIIRNYDMAELKRLDLAHHMPVQADYGLLRGLGGLRIITRAEGCTITDAEGHSLLDGMVGDTASGATGSDDQPQ